MPLEPVLTLLFVAVLANLVVMGGVLLPPMIGRKSPLSFGRQIDHGDRVAAELGVSEAAVRARTNRLVDRGILQVVGVTDPLKLGFQQMAMIGIRCEADRLMSVAARVAEFAEVDYVVITAGTYDILIETVCEDNEGLLRFLAERLRTIEGVRDTETFVYLRMVKQSYQWGTR